MGSNIPFSSSGQKLNAPFNPTQISGCQLWLDAADKNSYTLSGTNVTSWADKSETRKTLTVSGTPTYKANATGNLPAIVFSSSMLTTTFSSTFGSGDVAYFAVWIQYTNNSSILMTLGGTTTPGLGMGCNGQYNFFEWGVAGAESDYTFSGSITFNRYVVQSGTIRSNSMLCSVNGYSGSAATSSQAQTSTTFNIGSATSVGSGYAINGEIAELIVYVGTISTSQQQQIEGYLAWKWGISLNPSHPYASVNQNTPLYPNVPYTYLPYAQSSPEFTPLLLPGCICWLDGADPNGTGTPPTNGTSLTSWKDKSVSNFSFTSSGSAYSTTALNGLPGINLSTNFFGYDPGSAQNNWQEVFAVGIWTGGSTFTSFNGFVTSSVNSDGGLGGGILFIGNSGTTDWYTIGNTYATPFINGTQTYTAIPTVQAPFQVRTFSATAVNLRGLRFGVDRSFTDRIWQGFISEVICYNTALTSTQRYKVEAYLAKKWKLTSVLNRQNIYASGSYLSFATVPVMPSLPMRLAAQNNKFLPTQISGLQLWLDASDRGSITLSGTSVTQWNDKSGLGNNVLNSYISGTLTYGTNNISSGSSSYFYAPVDSRRSTAPNLQVFIIYRWLNSTAGTNQGLWGDDDGGWNRLQLLSFPATSQDAYGLSLGAANAANVATTTNTSNILGTSNTIIYHASYNAYTTNGSFVFLNGTTAATFTDTAPSPQTSLTNTWFSAIGPNNDLPSQIRFSEILMYNTTLTDAQRQQLEGYFAWKWGLKTSLPAGHPFSLLAPLPMP